MSTNVSQSLAKRIMGWLRLQIVASVIEIALLVVLLFIAITTFGTKINVLASLGFNFFAVTSGSMSPTIPTGSVIRVGKYTLEELKIGDIITYQLANPSGQPAVVTHRIHAIDKQESQEFEGEGEDRTEKTVITYSFTTKGDANQEPDSYVVRPSDIIGLYTWHVPHLGFVTSFAQTQKGFLLLVITPAALLILWEIVSIIMNFKQQYERKTNQEIERLKQELAKKSEEKSIKHE